MITSQFYLTEPLSAGQRAFLSVKRLRSSAFFRYNKEDPLFAIEQTVIT